MTTGEKTLLDEIAKSQLVTLFKLFKIENRKFKMQ